MPDREILHLSALEQAEMLRARELSATELLEVYLTRIARHDPALNAFVQLLAPRARRRAQAIDRSLSRAPEPASPTFLGVPFAIKDTDPVRFTWNRAGSRALKWVWTPFDAPQVRRLERAGFVIAGKTATSELALLPVVETDLQAPTANPWNTGHSAGGSSGGAAAAVAGGLLPIAHAADGGGSIRIPAAFCHLYGFKASRGLTPNFYAAMDPFGWSSVGCVARTVGDSAAVMDALCGRPHHPPVPGSLLASLDEPEPEALRVGLCLRSPLGPVDPAIASAVEDLARTLEEMGHAIEPVDPPEAILDEVVPLFGRLFANVPIPSPSRLQPVTRWIREQGAGLTRAEADRRTVALAERLLAWSTPYDLLLTPTVGRRAPSIGEWAKLPPADQFRAAAELGAFTAAGNVAGTPAASLPLGLSEDGLPVAAMLAGRPGADRLVLRMSRALERRLDWNRRLAPMLRP